MNCKAQFVIEGKPEDAGWYDRIYKENPNHWRSDGRDRFAYEAVRDLVEWDSKKLLDLGCGTGHTLAYLGNKWPEVSCSGLDISAEAAMIAAMRLPRANVLVGDISDYFFPFQFDLILMLGVAEHFEDPVRTLDDVRLNLGWNGLAYIEVPNCLGYPGMDQTEGFRRLDRGSRQMEWHLKRESWEAMIEQAGLQIVRSLTGARVEWEFVWVVQRRHSFYELSPDWEKSAISLSRDVFKEDYHAMVL